ncbi:MAG TPA: cupin domain-containing protein [Gaiellaceae bacterium]|nr:cupin domain-containing protein [Gaiellaceae bacterium]
MSRFDELRDIGPLPIWEGIVARNVAGEQMNMAIVELDPGAVAAEHSHPNEQLGFVISGSITFRIGDETRELGPGATYAIPGGVAHEATAGPEGCVVMDAFAPPRDDWERFTPQEPRPPRWP